MSYQVTENDRAGKRYGSLSPISCNRGNYKGRTEGGIGVLFDINLKSELPLILLMDLQFIKFTQGHVDF